MTWAGAAPVAFVLLWSTGFVGAKYGLPYAEPFTFLALRLAIAASLLGVAAAAAGGILGGVRGERNAGTARGRARRRDEGGRVDRGPGHAKCASRVACRACSG